MPKKKETDPTRGMIDVLAYVASKNGLMPYAEEKNFNAKLIWALQNRNLIWADTEGYKVTQEGCSELGRFVRSSLRYQQSNIDELCDEMAVLRSSIAILNKTIKSVT